MTGKTMTVKAVADTLEEAFAQAQDKMPDNAAVLEKKEIAAPDLKIVMIEAFDEHVASSDARSRAMREFDHPATVKSVTLTTMGQKGFLGIGKKPNQYKAEILEKAVVEIVYKIIPPNVEELRATGNVEGLIKALSYREDDAIGQAALTALSEMGRAKDAVKALKTMHGAYVVKLLAQALENSDADVRVSAIEALDGNKRSSASKLLIEALNDSDTNVRKTAIQLLAKSKDAQAAKLIVAALADRSSVVRKQAAHSLESMGSSALRPLIAALEHKKKNVRKSAINALGKIGDAKAMEALEKALGDKVPDVRKEVPMALGNSAALLRMQRGGSLAPISQVAGVLVSALEKGDPATRDEIVMTLTLLSGEDYGYDAIRWKVWAEKLSHAALKEMLSKTDVDEILSEYGIGKGPARNKISQMIKDL